MVSHAEVERSLQNGASLLHVIRITPHHLYYSSGSYYVMLVATANRRFAQVVIAHSNNYPDECPHDPRRYTTSLVLALSRQYTNTGFIQIVELISISKRVKPFHAYPFQEFQQFFLIYENGIELISVRCDLITQPVFATIRNHGYSVIPPCAWTKRVAYVLLDLWVLYQLIANEDVAETTTARFQGFVNLRLSIDLV
ncbi:hypothetical protein K493DRAFT_302121 [Basidiobolus meristosporus CBS 931.73]|uniref:Uncharacterized protein n=1 Tax=Basidiobolus meristosporus CBS 931.73 TaxID=1314790 RepID=A0A1Y1Y8K2_9FUNG|nr:hypothetical protein K493DRAFT_302121 [Basidiobolus meristosporus CBS 931.73]|eukprot:ORX94350.1 hypothetical protein K493DRAFT_302121 [Basidiobolus meristosporus CBS 931.73]